MSWASDPFPKMAKRNTLQGINISYLGKRKIIFKSAFLWDTLVPNFFVLCILVLVFDSKLDVSPVATGKKPSKFRSFPRVFPILGYPTVGIIFIHFWHKRSNHSHQSWVERQSGQPEVLSFFGLSLH